MHAFEAAKASDAQHPYPSQKLSESELDIVRQLRYMFQNVDPRKTGNVSKMTARRILLNVGTWTEEDLDEFLELAETDANQVDYETACDWIMDYAGQQENEHWKEQCERLEGRLEHANLRIHHLEAALVDGAHATKDSREHVAATSTIARKSEHHCTLHGGQAHLTDSRIETKKEIKPVDQNDSETKLRGDMIDTLKKLRALMGNCRNTLRDDTLQIAGQLEKELNIDCKMKLEEKRLDAKVRTTARQQNKLLLHFDVNGTILAVDPASGQDMAAVINTFLAGACWGREVDGTWKWSKETENGNMRLTCPADAETSYYKYLENRVADRKAFKASVGAFSKEFKQFSGVADQIVTALRAPESLRGTPFAFEQSGEWFHTIFPSVWRLLASLQEQGREFSLVIRTFGSNGPDIARALNAFVKGEHPAYQAVCDGWCFGDAMQGCLTFNDAGVMHLQLESQSFEGEEAICAYFQNIEGILVVKDDYTWWKKHNFTEKGGKPFWVVAADKANAPHTIFFDDNFRPDAPENSILDVKLAAPCGSGYELKGRMESAFAETIGCAHTANLQYAVVNEEYYMGLVRQLEEKWKQNRFLDGYILDKVVRNAPTKQNKLILHFDVNGTILAVDPASGQDMAAVINTFLAGACWGKETGGTWNWSKETENGNMRLTCPADAETSYYKYLEDRVTDRKAFKASVGSFSKEFKQFSGVADQIFTALRAPESLRGTPFAFEQSGQWFHTVFPSVWRLLASLQEKGRDFSIVIRTFGSNGPEIAKALHAFAKGEHPAYRAVCDGCRLGDPAQGCLTFNDTGNMHLQLESRSLEGEEAICAYFQDIHGSLVVKDDYTWWKKHNFSEVGGKPVWIVIGENQDVPHTMFFDDNFRPDAPDNSILNVKIAAPSGSGYELKGRIESELAERIGCAHTANLQRAVVDEEYYVNLVKQLEEKWSADQVVAPLPHAITH